MFKLYKIATFGQGSLFASPKPDAANLTGSLDQISSANILNIVCLLESDEMKTLGLTNFQAECAKHDIDFIHFPIRDFGTPSFESLCIIASKIEQLLQDGQNTLVHCRGGIGRTGTLCGCVMVANGKTPDQAINHVTLQRGCDAPETQAQRELIKQFSASRTN